MEENKELATVDVETGEIMENDLTSATAIVNELKLNNNFLITLKDLDKPKTKLKVLKAVTTPDVALEDAINTEIEIADFVAYYNINEKTGVKTPVFILFDSKGKTYSTGSIGVFNFMKQLLGTMGMPDEWEEPIKVKAIKKQGKEHKFTTLEVIF